MSLYLYNMPEVMCVFGKIPQHTKLTCSTLSPKKCLLNSFIWSLSSCIFFKKWADFKQIEGIHTENTAGGCVRARQRNTEGLMPLFPGNPSIRGDFKPLDVSSLQSTVVGVCVCVCVFACDVCVCELSGRDTTWNISPS